MIIHRDNGDIDEDRDGDDDDVYQTFLDSSCFPFGRRGTSYRCQKGVISIYILWITLILS